MRGPRLLAMLVPGVLLISASFLPAEPSAAERGEKALLGRSFLPTSWSVGAYETAWRQWGEEAKTVPASYDEAFRERYGLHVAPYPNGRYPMGLRESRGLLGKGITSDCLLCHGGSIAGKNYVGLGNASLDMQALYEDLAAADGRKGKTPFLFSNVRGTTEAGAMAVFLLGMREPDLSLRTSRLNLDLRDDLCEDAPAWWLLKKKKTIYHTGGGDARSVRTLMQFMMSPLNPPSAFEQAEPVFADIQAYLRSLQPPPYPFAIDSERARKGQGIFENTCSRCHGTYGARWTYPNRIVPLEDIGTDPTRARGFTDRFVSYYNKSWFGHENAGWFADNYPARLTNGYQAPPLDGIWATAPYLHNGSVPTVYHVLNSRSRPRIFTRSFRTGKEEYDPEKLGWKVQVLDADPGKKRSANQRRKVYDTTQPGRGNAGHRYGDQLTEEERWAVIEYLKTL